MRGSGREPYRVALDLAGEPAWTCSCPSRKQPCKHALGLLLLLARGQVPAGSRPPEGRAWLEGRNERTVKQVARSRSAEVADPAAQERRRARRAANVETGIVDLERWLDDLVRGGLAAAQSRSWSSWDDAAARLVDAQAPGLASRMRALGRAAHSGPGWPDRLLAQLGRLHLVLEGWRHLADLSPPLAAEVRTQVGFPTARADVQALLPVRDLWDVLAAVVSDDGTLATRRVWLRGRTVGGWALLLDTGPSGAAFATEVDVGTTFEADVHRYPGALGQRSLVGERHGAAVPIADLEGCPVADALAADALSLAANPWLPQTPVCLGPVVPAIEGARWLVVDERGTVVPEHLVGHGRRRRQAQLRDVIICVDQSGSMATSVVHASILAAVLGSIRSLRTSLVVFDTEVADLTEHLHDPVDLLFGVQLGGGTDIARAVAYCQRLVHRPADTVLVLVTDLFEGGDADQLRARIAGLVRSGVTVVCLLALSDSGAPSHNDELAAQMAALGVPCFACTPDAFPALMAAALEGREVGAWAEGAGLPTSRPAGSA